jgi:hypothetical protein
MVFLSWVTNTRLPFAALANASGSATPGKPAVIAV